MQRRKIPEKTCAAAVGLLVVGIILFALALDFFIENPDHDGSLPLLILAILGEGPTSEDEPSFNA